MPRRFDFSPPPSRARRIAYWGVGIFVAANVVLAMISGVRAIRQLYSVNIVAASDTLRAGDTLSANVVTSGRTYATLRLELVQESHVMLLGEEIIPGNGDGALDPRPKHGALTVRLADSLLSAFQRGDARLRATALGRSQWLRVPPPLVVERNVIVSER